MDDLSFNDVSSLRHAKDDRLAVSPTAAARMLGIGRTLLYELIDRGELKSIRIGARRLITTRALERFLTERESSS